MPLAKKYRKKPVVIEAVQYVGAFRQGADIQAWSNAVVNPIDEGALAIITSEGTMVARRGDWIVRGVEGEFYPVKDSVFHATYEAVE